MSVQPRVLRLEERCLLTAGPISAPEIPASPNPLLGKIPVDSVGVYMPGSNTFALGFLNPNQPASSPFLGQSVFKYGGQAGSVQSIPITGRFHGTAVTDVGVYIPSTNTFAIAYLNSSGQVIGQAVFQYGTHTGTNYNIPITGDFNGDGTTDIGVYSPSTNTFALAYLNPNPQPGSLFLGQSVFQYGTHKGTDYSVPITGDFNGDGTTDVGIFMPSTDTFALAYLNPSSKTSPFLGQRVFRYGSNVGGVNSVPITGDFNGDGTTDVGIYAPAADTFALAYLNPSSSASSPFLGQRVFQYGAHTGTKYSVPITGDFNGDGRTDVGIFVPSTDTFALAYLNASSTASPFLGQSVFSYGYNAGGVNAVPITGNFNGNGQQLFFPGTSADVGGSSNDTAIVHTASFDSSVVQQASTSSAAASSLPSVTSSYRALSSASQPTATASVVLQAAPSSSPWSTLPSPTKARKWSW